MANNPPGPGPLKGRASVGAGLRYWAALRRLPWAGDDHPPPSAVIVDSDSGNLSTQLKVPPGAKSEGTVVPPDTSTALAPSESCDVRCRSVARLGR